MLQTGSSSLPGRASGFCRLTLKTDLKTNTTKRLHRDPSPGARSVCASSTRPRWAPLREWEIGRLGALWDRPTLHLYLNCFHVPYVSGTLYKQQPKTTGGKTALLTGNSMESGKTASEMQAPRAQASGCGEGYRRAQGRCGQAPLLCTAHPSQSWG